MNTNIRVRGGLDSRRVQSGKIGRQQPGLQFSRVALVMAGLFAAGNALAAQIDPAELAQLESEAKRAGVVRVMVSLDDSVTLEAMHNNLAAVRSAMQQKANTLLAELGDDAWDVAQWQNGVGQMGVYVNASGLKKLAASNNAVAFMPDSTHAYRVRVSDSDGSLDEVEQAIDAKGYADVEVLLNVEGDYDIDKQGNSVFRPSAAMLSEIADKLRAIGARKFAGNLRNLIAPAANPARPEPTFKVRLDRKAFYALREDTDVRAIRPLGFKDKRQAHWPAEVLEKAKAEGSADVIISLRGGSAYSPKGGYMSAAAWKAQGKAHGRVFDDVLVGAGVTRTSVLAQEYSGVGGMMVRLPYPALARLYANADPRILGVSLDKPRLQAMLATSTSTQMLNMQKAWDKGFRAAGQSIIVLDSGVKKDHGFFTRNGTSKVTYEACFGKDVPAKGVISMCPQKNENGDSPLGLAGSGLPWSTLAACENVHAAGDENHCDHGSHVAGIAAGYSSQGLQGVAPDASIIAVQMFSYRAPAGSRRAAALAFDSDFASALEAVNNAAELNDKFVVNMSIGDPTQVFDSTAACLGRYTGEPDPHQYQTRVAEAIKNLTSRRVPAVAATGNGTAALPRSTNGIVWPACLPGVVKVAAVANDGTGHALAEFSHIANPDNFVEKKIWLAPGGSNTSRVISASGTTNGTLPMAGTSQAAPHVSGLLAAYKAAVPGTSVGDALAWLERYGSFELKHYAGSPYLPRSFRRVRVPDDV